MGKSSYVGRFAPSPTGPLHFGSLVAALASYADALKHHGAWHVRLDNLDQVRAHKQACQLILHSLAVHGFRHDGDVVYQCQRTAQYQQAFDALSAQLYPCTCSKKMLSARLRHGADNASLVYDRYCLARTLSRDEAVAWRLYIAMPRLIFDDAVHGQIDATVGEAIGDFIVKRRDGFFAYHLATVVDDQALQVSHVVRGADLLTSTLCQVYVQHCLQLATPVYGHVPVVYAADGRKLSKSNGARAVNDATPLANLLNAWRALKQVPLPPCHSVAEFWYYASRFWSLTATKS